MNTSFAQQWRALALAFSVLAASCGGGGGGGTETPAPPVTPTPASTLSLLSGTTSGVGNQDGPGASALFGRPGLGLALSSTGDVLIADAGNRAVRKLTAAGVVSTLAGGQNPAAGAIDNYLDGPGTAARFQYPQSVVADSAGNTYVADSANHVIRKIDRAGVVTTVAGSPDACGSADGARPVATLCYPQSIQLDSAGNLYFSQPHTGFSNWLIRKITPSGAVSTVVQGPISDSANLGFVVDTASNIFLTRGSSIQKYTAEGGLVTFSGSAEVPGTADGAAADARFGPSIKLALDAAQRLYVLDWSANQPVTVRLVAQDGAVSTVARSAQSFPYVQATSLVVDAVGDFIAGLGNGHSTWIQKYARSGNQTVLAGKIMDDTLPTDGTGANASFKAPLGLALTSSGALYVGDFNASALLRIVNPDGATRSVTIQRTDSVPNVSPSWRAMAVDGQDNIYTTSIAMSLGDPTVVFKITPAGNATVLADLSGWIGPFNAGGYTMRYKAAANGLAVDAAGNVYASGVNGVIVKITPQGAASLLAGAPGALGHVDGPGSTARFGVLGNMALDAAGNLYVVDGLHDSVTGIGPTIRKITPAGVVSTVTGQAGLPAALVDGPAGSARLAGAGISAWYGGLLPVGSDFASEAGDGYAGTASLAADGKGNLYLTDPVNSVIRKIAADGSVSTVVGQVGLRGFAAGALPGIIHTPIGIAVWDSTLYVTTRNAVAQVKALP